MTNLFSSSVCVKWRHYVLKYKTSWSWHQILQLDLCSLSGFFNPPTPPHPHSPNSRCTFTWEWWTWPEPVVTAHLFLKWTPTISICVLPPWLTSAVCDLKVRSRVLHWTRSAASAQTTHQSQHSCGLSSSPSFTYMSSRTPPTHAKMSCGVNNWRLFVLWANHDCWCRSEPPGLRVEKCPPDFKWVRVHWREQKVLIKQPATTGCHMTPRQQLQNQEVKMPEWCTFKKLNLSFNHKL